MGYIEETIETKRKALDLAPPAARFAINFSQKILSPVMLGIFCVHAIYGIITKADFESGFQLFFFGSLVIYGISLIVTLPFVWQYFRKKNDLSRYV